MIQSSFVIIKGDAPCSWCDKATEVLDKHGLPYMVRILSLVQLREAAERANMSTVPIIYHGVNKVGGHADLVKYIDAHI